MENLWPTFCNSSFQRYWLKFRRPNIKKKKNVCMDESFTIRSIMCILKMSRNIISCQEYVVRVNVTAVAVRLVLVSLWWVLLNVNMKTTRWEVKQTLLHITGCMEIKSNQRLRKHVSPVQQATTSLCVSKPFTEQVHWEEMKGAGIVDQLLTSCM